jgi:prefoldin subunit 5
MIKINVKIVVLINRMDELVVIVKIGIGIRSTISISKTIKIIANKKNRMENGIRAL